MTSISMIQLDAVVGGATAPDAYGAKGSPGRCAWIGSAISHRLAAKNPNLRKGVDALIAEGMRYCE